MRQTCESGEAVGDWLQQRVISIMGMFANLLSKVFGHSTQEPCSTDVPPTTTVESATAPSATTPTASAVSSLSATSVAPSTPDQESDGPESK
jgi:hypothetical protein